MPYNVVFQAIMHFTSVVFLAVGALLPIVDPLGGAPIYISMTAGLTPEQRQRMAKAVAINSFLLLLASTLIGAYVLDFFGLSIPAVQVAGGVVVCSMGWQLLNSPNAVPNMSAAMRPPSTPEYLGRARFLSDDDAADRRTRVDLRGAHPRRQSAARISLAARDFGRAHGGHTDRRPERLPVRPLRRRRSCGSSGRSAPAWSCACRPSSCCASACKSYGMVCTRWCPAACRCRRTEHDRA